MILTIHIKEMNKPKTPVYKILEYIRDTKDKENADDFNNMREFIQEEFPEDFEQFESDNYDGPGDNFYLDR